MSTANLEHIKFMSPNGPPTGTTISRSYYQIYGRFANVSSTNAKVLENTITLQNADSNLWVDLNTSLSGFGSYSDTDSAFYLVWKTGAISTSLSDYNSYPTSHPDNGMNRQVLGSGGSFVGGGTHLPFWGTDTSPPGASGGQYWNFIVPFSGLIDLGSVSANTQISVALWLRTTNGDYYVGGPRGNGRDDSGFLTQFNLFEIQG